MLLLNQRAGFGSRRVAPVLMFTSFDAASKGSEVTLAGGNLIASFSGVSGHGVRTVLGVSSGKWYWEVSSGGNAAVGVYVAANNLNAAGAWPGSQATSYGYGTDGTKRNNGTGTAYGATFTGGDVIGVALDLGAGKIWFAKNGTWQASGNPAAGTNEAFSGLSGTYYAGVGYFGGTAGNTNTANFGASAFAHSAPSGFNAGLYS